jgi:2-polyprenyl-3-methyl-5-hydroxy-6-metoxy-1,4-benzoquinol methylase
MFKVETKHPVAVDSPDHIMPWGTMRDNSTNPSLVNEVINKYGVGTFILDLGCSGGQWIKELAERGMNAIGLEGSDFSIKNPREWWTSLHNINLFTCDITKPFQIYFNDKPAKFKVITSWAVFEHFKKEDLPMVCENLLKHMDDDAVFCGNIGNENCPEIVEGHVLHQTVESYEWWKEYLSQYFEVIPYPFNNYVRLDNNTFLIGLKKK